MKISALRIRIFMKHMDASEELKCISPFIATDYSHKAHTRRIQGAYTRRIQLRYKKVVIGNKSYHYDSARKEVKEMFTRDS